jgi:hypothetical protein
VSFERSCVDFGRLRRELWIGELRGRTRVGEVTVAIVAIVALG